MEWVWLQREFPWLGPGFIHAVADNHVEAFRFELESREFVVAELRTPVGATFAAELYRAFGINHYEPIRLSWDAFHDYFTDLKLPPRFALIWRSADEFAARETKVFAEAAAILTPEFDELGKANAQAILVLTGNGPSFGSPSNPIGR